MEISRNQVLKYMVELNLGTNGYTEKEGDVLLKQLLTKESNGKLFRFRPLTGKKTKRELDLLNQGLLYFGSVRDTNDLFDCLPAITLTGFVEAFEDYLLVILENLMHSYFQEDQNIILLNRYNAIKFLKATIEINNNWKNKFFIEARNVVSFLIALKLVPDEICRKITTTSGPYNDYIIFSAKKTLYKRHPGYEMFPACISEENTKSFAIECTNFQNRYEKIMSSNRMCCFTTSPFSMTMWAHYASNNSGICIEYDLNKAEGPSKTILLPVIYCRKRPEYTWPQINPKRNKNIESLIYSLFSKSIEWESEQEWRALVLSSEKENLFVDMPPISCVYVGYKCADENVKTICEIASRKKFKVAKIIMALDEYKLDSRIIYDPNDAK